MNSFKAIFFLSIICFCNTSLNILIENESEPLVVPSQKECVEKYQTLVLNFANKIKPQTNIPFVRTLYQNKYYQNTFTYKSPAWTI